MRAARCVSVLWPGLPDLWLRGAWSGLGVACGFAWLLNLALVSTWWWTELLDPPVRWGVWLAVAVFWLGSVVAGARLLRREAANAATEGEDGFIGAQSAYLKGEWFEAEAAVQRLLARNAADIDARLLLAGVLRHTGRTADAQQQLRRLAASEGSRKWELEIQREWQRLAIPAGVPTSGDS